MSLKCFSGLRATHASFISPYTKFLVYQSNFLTVADFNLASKPLISQFFFQFQLPPRSSQASQSHRELASGSAKRLPPALRLLQLLQRPADVQEVSRQERRLLLLQLGQRQRGRKASTLLFDADVIVVIFVIAVAVG